MLQKVQDNQLDCFHCGLAVAGEPFCAEFEGVERQFCCPACRAICTTIIDSGLASFYQHQNQSKQAASLEAVTESFSAFDDSDFQLRFVTRNEDESAGALSNCDLLIGGIHCVACVWLLEKYLAELPGVESVHVSYSEQKATIAWRAEQLQLSSLCQAIARLGYQPEPYSADELTELQQRENHQALRRLGVAGIAMMQVGMFAIALYAGALQGIALEYRDFMRWISLLVATPVVFYCAKPFFMGAWRGLLLKKPGMDLPVAIAIGLAYIASCRATILGAGEVYFDSVTMFTFLLLAGRYLEMRARHFSGRLNSDLSSLLPSTAIRLTRYSDGRIEQQSLPLFKIKRDDLLLIKAGQVIPADGLVTDGRSPVNEAQLTGEFMPQLKIPGDSVVAGTINGAGVLTMQVQSTGPALQLQSINDLLRRAQANKPRVTQLADHFASYFVSAVLLLAAATYAFWRYSDAGQQADNAFWIMLSVLVVSCPCALSLATPAAMTAATNRLRRIGVLVTDSQLWEKLPTITHVVCDKTGTLTRGELSLATIKPLTTLDRQACLRIAATLEGFSEHPIAKAFSHEQAVAASVTEVDIATGEGLQANIDGECYRLGRSEYAAALYGRDNETVPERGQWILLSNKQGPVCWFQLQDPLRRDAPELIAGLRAQGLAIHLLSGDSSGAAQQLSEQLKLDYCVAAASPQDKLDYIHGLQQRGARVLMLGDGINDIPVLAAADVSVAMANASNLAKTHADSILLTGRLSGVLELIEHAARTRRIIRQNISWALGYNLLAIPMAAMAMIPPYLAAIGMSLSSLVVIINALRLQRHRQAEFVAASVYPATAEAA